MGHKTPQGQAWLKVRNRQQLKAQVGTGSCCFHAHQQFLDEPGRALLRDLTQDAIRDGSFNSVGELVTPSRVTCRTGLKTKTLCLEGFGRSHPR